MKRNSVIYLMLVIWIIVVSGNKEPPKDCTQDENWKGLKCTIHNKNDLQSIKEQKNVTYLIIKDCDWPILSFGRLFHFTELHTLSILNCNTALLKKPKKTLALKAVHNVSIQYTQIDQIRENTFSFFPNVQYISLDNNQIETVEKNSFKGLSYLKSVNLSHNLIQNIKEGTVGAKLFDLSNNQIRSSTERSTEEEKNDFVYAVQLVLVFLGVVLFSCIAYRYNFVFTICSFTSKCQKSIMEYLSPKRVGQIEIFPKEKLGNNVFKGKLRDKRIVAVKRIPKASICNIPEVEILIKLQQNKNIITYVLSEENQTYIYLALMPLCKMTLADAITIKDERVAQYLKAGENSCLEQLAKGLEFIHSQNVQHRDIKPRNILVFHEGRGLVRFIITDFDLGHITGKDSNPEIRYGTMGWVAPELRHRAKRSSKVDIFSMGCVFYYALTQGEHPFGIISDMRRCQENIQAKNPPVIDDSKLNAQQLTNYRKEQAKDLIDFMIKFDPAERPRASKVLDHPFFWEDIEIVRFFINIGNCFDDMKAEAYTNLRTYLNASSQRVYEGNWMNAIQDSEVKHDVKGRNGEDVCSLLKVVRDKITHIDRMKETAHKNSQAAASKKPNRSQKLVEIYKDPKGVAHYYNELFPQLLLHTYYAKSRFDEETPAQT